jgi:hypothetical protein
VFPTVRAHHRNDMADSILQEGLAQVRPIDAEIASLAASLRLDMNMSEKSYSRMGTPNDFELGRVEPEHHVSTTTCSWKRFMALLALTSSIVVSIVPVLFVTGDLSMSSHQMF